MLTPNSNSDLTSLASSVARGIYENGRRYHSYGKERVFSLDFTMLELD